MASGAKMDKDPTVIKLKEFQENFKVMWKRVMTP